jgi:hypothetical protein
LSKIIYLGQIALVELVRQRALDWEILVSNLYWGDYFSFSIHLDQMWGAKWNTVAYAVIHLMGGEDGLLTKLAI